MPDTPDPKVRDTKAAPGIASDATKSAQVEPAETKQTRAQLFAGRTQSVLNNESARGAIQALTVVVASVALSYFLAKLCGGAPLKGISSLLLCAKVAHLINWAAFVPSALKNTERFYDLVGSITFLSMIGVGLLTAILNHGFPSARQWLVSTVVTIWAVRLGGYLFYRMQRTRRDARFDSVRDNPFRFLAAWTLQAFWAFATALPALIVLTTKSKQAKLGWTDWLGLAVWAVGFGIEAIADLQKFVYRNKRPDHWVDVGLWRTARHPNYFGEVMLWVGVLLMAYKPIHRLQWVAALSPLFVYFLLTRVTGVPPLEKRAVRQWGTNPDFQKYRRSTNLLMPMPWRAS